MLPSSATWCHQTFFYLRHRQALRDVVTGIISNDEAATDTSIRCRLPGTVVDMDKEQFIQLVLDEFKSLHTDNAIRFGFSALDYAAWEKRHVT
jgi:coproporphyrinogen III oxidase